MQNEQQSTETWNVSDSEVEKNNFISNKAPIIKDTSGQIIINYHVAPIPSDHNLDTVAARDDDASVPYLNSPGNSKTLENREKLKELLTEKRELEIKLERIESEISRIEAILKSEAHPDLALLLHWLSGRKHLAEKYGKIVLRGFPNLRQEAEAQGNLDDFYFQIEHYLELIHLSLSKDKKLFLREPGIPPTFADCEIYKYAAPNIYVEVFRRLKENIPQDNVESSLRSKLEDHFDELLKRLQVYF
jgi:hypothetical protein